MMRTILATASLAHGGAEHHSVCLMNRLAERGHECHAVFVKSGAQQLERLRLKNGGSAESLDAARYFDQGALRKYASRLAAVGPTVVVAANPYALMYSWLAMRLARLKLPLVATYHSTRLAGAKEHIQMLAYRPLFWAIDCTVFVSRNQMRYCVRRGVFSRRNEVIHNGVDTDRFAARTAHDERADRLHAFGFTAEDYVVGMVAALRPEKNHLQLVDAIAALRAMSVPARALIIGDGAMRPAVEARARARNVERYVTITGFQQDVRPWVGACDVVALCSTAVETFSLAALEAMALGKPVVHADLGGASEMVFPGRNGFLFPVGDDAAFVSHLAALADRPRARAMGRNARAVVETLFSEKAMVDRYESLLLEFSAEALQTKPAPAS